METGTGKMGVPVRASPPTPSGSNSSSLAMVVDKRPPHRPGGCVGIFLQLFDWNRRLANRKFFSRKLLPQVRAAKKISKKFAGDERMPAAKLLLIADENRGGFPSTKKAEACGAARSSPIHSATENGMCTPGLVARLMGLESMPATVRQDEPRKAVDGAASSSDSGCYFDGSDTSGSFRHYQDLGLEAGGGSGITKLERRPQKLQKTGFFDRRPVTAAARVGSEALLFNKTALARSRKRHHKLASPVKSPRLLGRRSSARLMEAATRILEPGLQARNLARCSLTYMAPLQTSVEEVGTSPLLQRPGEPPGAPLLGPCKNCGNLVQAPDFLKADEPSVAVEHGSSSTSSEFSNTSTHDVFAETASKAPRMPSLVVQSKTNTQSRSLGSMARKPLLQNEVREMRKPPPETGVLGSGIKQSSIMRPNEVILVREKVAAAPKLGTKQLGRREPRSLNESRDFVAMNRNLNNCSRTRAAPKVTDSPRIEVEGNAWDKRPLVRKRRSVGNITQIEGTAAINSTCSKQRTAITTSEARDGKGAKQTSARPIRGNSQKLRTGDCGSDNKNTSAVSFTFSAPTRNDGMPSASVSEKSKAGRLRGGISQPGTLAKAPNAGKKVDSLSALLEEKIWELTRLNQDDSAAGDEARSKSTAAILEELIDALTAARSMPQKEYDPPVDLRLGGESKGPSERSHSPVPKLSVIQDFQAEEKSKASPGVLNSSDYDQPSPVSILEASFSNDSCLSESFNSSSGHRPQIRFMDTSFDKLKPWDLDADLSDSATSTHFRKIGPGRPPLSLLESIFMMSNTDSHGNGSTGSKHNHVREVIANAELIFQSTYSEEPDGRIYSSIDFVLFDTLETLFCAFWESPNFSPGFSVTEEELKLRRILFDCIVEHLDVKYSYRCKVGYNAWAKQPPFTRDKLAQEICKEIKNCRNMPGKTLDEIVEKDMTYINEQWTDFEIEACEAGVEVENDLLQLLMDETVLDLLQC
ncbi:hypothetical protein Taro_006709 [Colocasia esculenta]|uniref:DUF4378 domain-containing protein n=1 Tax=Colocasia esculenta TaxID=4460 RepID=A0A843TPG4_COLES|nr:hypothetical protein [Colocasia esculenta]